MELFKTVPPYFMDIYLLLQLLRMRDNNIKSIENLSRRHSTDSFDVPEILG